MLPHMLMFFPLLLTDEKWTNWKLPNLTAAQLKLRRSLWLKAALTRNVPPINGVCSPLPRDTMKYSQFFNEQAKNKSAPSGEMNQLSSRLCHLTAPLRTWGRSHGVGEPTGTHRPLLQLVNVSDVFPSVDVYSLSACHHTSYQAFLHLHSCCKTSGRN